MAKPAAKPKSPRSTVLSFQRLDVDAPIGTYLVDDVVARCCQLGVFPPSATFRVRKDANSAAEGWCSAVEDARLAPRRAQIAERFFKDLMTIRHRIERNMGASRHEIAREIHPDYWGRDGTSGDVADLLNRLSVEAATVGKFLDKHSLPKKRGGNRDQALIAFMDSFEIEWGCWLMRNQSYSETQTQALFVELIAAAWTDLKMPMPARASRGLKTLIRDRVRNLLEYKIEANSAATQ